MNRNQKIALGCGGAGCLGLILFVVLCVVLVVAGVVKAPGLYDPGPNRNYNYNSNSNYNYNSNGNSNSNDNTSSDSSAMSEDDKHKLFQAAAVTQDFAVILRVSQKLGLMDANGTPNSEYEEFVRAHPAWGSRNLSFIQSVNTPEKARAYVDEHIDD